MTNQYEEKRKLEKRVCKVSMSFMDLPPSTTAEGFRQYLGAQRKLIKVLENPAFRCEFVEHYSGFVDFLKRYDLNAPDLEKMLNTDMRLLIWGTPQKKKNN